MSGYDPRTTERELPRNIGENQNMHRHSGQQYPSQPHWRDSIDTQMYGQMYAQGYQPMPEMNVYRERITNIYAVPGTHIPSYQQQADPGSMAGPSNRQHHPPQMHGSQNNIPFTGPSYVPDMKFHQQPQNNINIPYTNQQPQNNINMPYTNQQAPYRPVVTTTRRTSQGTIPFSYQTSTTLQVDTNNQSPADDKHKLDTNYRRRATPRKFFTFGKVFLTLWSEPAGDSISSAPSAHSMPSAYSAAPPSSAISSGRFGEQVFSKIRRFVVIRPGDESSIAVPINTYRQQGVARRGIRKSEHAIVYSGKKAPDPLESETPNRDEDGLLPQAIRVDLDQNDEKLDAESRIDFGKLYTIEHKAKVRSLGKVNRDSEHALVYQFEIVWARTMRANATASVTPSSSRALTSIPEAVGTHRVVDWALALALLIKNGWPEERARAVLKEDPRRQRTATTRSTVKGETKAEPSTAGAEQVVRTENVSSLLPIRQSKEGATKSDQQGPAVLGHAKKDSLLDL